jgi:hypothetical protein
MRGARLIVMVMVAAVLAGLVLLFVLRQQRLALRAHRQMQEQQAPR